MADNSELDPGTGGDTYRSKDRTGIKTQIVALDLAPGGAETLMNGVMPVSDNGGSLTVDGSVTADTELTTADLDTGAGTDTRAVVGLVIAKSGGAANISNSDPLPVSDAGGSLTVDGTVTVQDGGSTISVDDGGGNLSIDDGGNSITVDNGGTFAVQDSEKLADDAAFTVGTTKVQPVGYLADQSSTDSVNEGDVGAARMTLDRKQIVTVAPSSDTEGLSVSNNIDIDETEDAVKASAGKLYGWYLYNDGASEVYVKFYNDTTANVIVGTTAPTMTIPVPAGAAANVEFTNGIAFSAAITVAATTGVATADTGAPAANQVVGCILYQ